MVTDLGKVSGAVGAVAGIIYSFSGKKGMAATVLYTAVFAVAGIVVGNAATKFFEN